VGSVSTNACAKFRCTALRIKKALGIFGRLENWQQQQQEEEQWFFGTSLLGPQIKTVHACVRACITKETFGYSFQMPFMSPKQQHQSAKGQLVVMSSIWRVLVFHFFVPAVYKILLFVCSVRVSVLAYSNDQPKCSQVILNGILLH